jgi:hypothetical protein
MLWFRSKIHDKEELQALEKDLLKLEKATLRQKDKKQLQKNIFLAIQKNAVIDPVADLVSKIAQLAHKIELSPGVRISMRERILNFIERAPVLEMAFRSKPPFLNRLLSTALLFCLVVSAVFMYPFKIPVTSAAKATYLEDFSGEVFIFRDGKVFAAEKDFVLKQGDRLLTGKEGLATVRFLDDSTSRLAQSTLLELKRLYVEPLNPITTQIEISLKEGRLWTRVLNLVDENSQFIVDTQTAKAIVTKKAAFDVEILPSRKAVVTVFDNVVAIAPKEVALQSKPILAGYQAEIAEDNSTKTPKIIPISKKMEEDSSQKSWFSSNLEHDKKMEEVLVAQKEDALESASSLAIGSNDPESENSKDVLNSEIEQQKTYFLENYKVLQQGQTLLMRDQGKEGMKLLLQFQNVVRSMVLRLPEFEKKDPLQASLLRSLIESKISEQRKSLATFLPDDPLYAAKEILEETELFLAKTDIDKTLRRLAQAEGKLLEIQNLVEKADVPRAEKVLVRYKRQIDGFILKITPENKAELSSKLPRLFNKQFEQIKILTAIEKSLNLDAQKNFLLQVRSVRQEVLEKFIQTLEALPKSIPRKLMTDLKDFLQLYLTRGLNDEKFIMALVRLLAAHSEEDVADILKQVPENLGMVKVVEESTASAPETTEPETDAVQGELEPVHGSEPQEEAPSGEVLPIIIPDQPVGEPVSSQVDQDSKDLSVP